MGDVSNALTVLSRTPQAATVVPAPKAKWKTRILLPAMLLGVVCILLGWAARDAWLPSRPVRVVPAVVKTVSQSPGTSVFQAPGWIEADPYEVNVSALADGVVREVLVLEGESVKAGQEIVRLVDDDARLAFRREEAEWKAAQAAHEAARREWDHPVERRLRVAAAEARRAELDAERQKLEREMAVESARVAELTEQLRRQERAGIGEAIPEYDVVRTRLQLETQRALLEMARAKVPAIEAQRRAAEADVEAARENLRLRISERRMLDETAAALARAEVAREEAALRLSRMVVKAPSDGVVLRRMVEPGAKLMLGGDMPRSAQAVSLYDPARLQVRVDVPLADAAQVGVGQKARIAAEVLRDRSFDGEVTRIAHEADIQKNTLQVKVRIEKPAPELRPEMLARVQFLSRQGKDAAPTEKARVFVPERLLRRREDGRWQIWAVDEGRGVAVRREVTTGPGRMDGWVEAIDGVAPGDRLIADPPADLNDGDRIAVVGEAE